MTLPNDDQKTILKAIREIYRKERKGGLTQMQLALDIGISASTMSLILRYPQYRPGGYVKRQCREYVEKVKQPCPVEA